MATYPDFTVGWRLRDLWGILLFSVALVMPLIVVCGYMVFGQARVALGSLFVPGLFFAIGIYFTCLAAQKLIYSIKVQGDCVYLVKTSPFGKVQMEAITDMEIQWYYNESLTQIKRGVISTSSGPRDGRLISLSWHMEG